MPTADAVAQAVSDALQRCGKTLIVLNRPVISAVITRL